MTKNKPLCYVVTTLAPPTTGMTAISEKMVTALDKRGQLDLWAIRKPHGQPSILWFFYKNLGIMAGLARAAWCARRTDTIYIVPDSSAGLWANLVVHLPLLWLSRARIVFHHHVFRYIQVYDARMAKMCKSLEQRLFHILLCDNMRDRFEELYCGQMQTLSNAVFPDLPTPSPSVSKKCNSLGFLSNITVEKGILEFLAVAEAAQARWPELNVHIAGGTNDVSLTNRIESFIAQEPNTRTWHGPVYGVTKEAFFEEIDVLLFPSKYLNEAQPVTIFEALARNRPVLATDQGCIPSQIPSSACFTHADFREGAIALLEAWQDETAFADAVARHNASWEWSLRESGDQLRTTLANLSPAQGDLSNASASK